MVHTCNPSTQEGKKNKQEKNRRGATGWLLAWSSFKFQANQDCIERPTLKKLNTESTRIKEGRERKRNSLLNVEIL